MTRFPAVGGGGGAGPIAYKDRAETFAESDVSVTHDSTEVDGGSIGHADGPYSSTYDWSVTSGGSTTALYGVVINPNVNAGGVSFTVSNSYGYAANTAYIKTGDGSEILAETSTAAGSSETLYANIRAGTDYRIVVDGGTESDGETFPVETTDFDVVAGIDSGSRNTTDVDRIQNLSMVPALDGTAYIEWPQPDDIYRWDAATFNANPDGETVAVHVEESTDGGSTWTKIAGPISRGQDISAAPDSRCRFRVELSRADTSNSPTLDAIYRRWVV